MRMFSVHPEFHHDEGSSDSTNHTNDLADPPQAMPTNRCWQEMIIESLCPSTL